MTSKPHPSSLSPMPSPAHLKLVRKWGLIYSEAIFEPLLHDLVKLEDSYLRELAQLDPADFLSRLDQFAASTISQAAAKIIEHNLDNPAPKTTNVHIPAVNPNN